MNPKMPSINALIKKCPREFVLQIIQVKGASRKKIIPPEFKKKRN
jgi:hypothetical protein